MSKGIPFIIILDLDGTVIGDITLLDNYFELYRLASQLARSKKIKCEIPALDFGQFFSENQIIRPGFQEFIRDLPSNTEIFFYTCSTNDWAYQIIPQIEKHLNIRSNRPIFSREDACINHMYAPPTKYIKSLVMLIPEIVKSLSKKYPAISRASETSLREHIVLIDDMKDNIIESSSRQIVCKPYGANDENPPCFFDITRGIPREALEYPAVAKLYANKMTLFYYYNNKHFKIEPVSGPDGKLLAHMLTMSAFKSDDKFWTMLKKELERSLDKKHTLSDKQIAIINKRLAKLTASKVPS